jgi:transcriptional regulator with XRE-family HTH domain
MGRDNKSYYRIPGMNILADRLRQARSHAKLSQQDLADAIGISQSAIAQLENGGKGSRYLSDIAEACGVNMLWLRKAQGPMLPSTDAVLKTATVAEQRELAAILEGMRKARIPRK